MIIAGLVIIIIILLVGRGAVLSALGSFGMFLLATCVIAIIVIGLRHLSSSITEWRDPCEPLMNMSVEDVPVDRLDRLTECLEEEMENIKSGR
jgi:hypothetical protein